MFEHVEVDLGYDDMIAETSETGRLYLNPKDDSKTYPSITTVLSILSADGIAAWRKRVGEEKANQISYRASTRGTLVHEIIEKYIDNDADYRSGYMPNIVADFNVIKPILDGRIGKVFAQEVPLYSDHLGVAGRVDCIAEFDGKISVIDFKTSRKYKTREYITNYFQQEAFYAIAWEERTGTPIQQLVTIIASEEGSQVFIENRDDWTQELTRTIELYNEREHKRNS